MDNYSVEELEKEAKVILADHITNGGTFSMKTNDESKTVSKKFTVSPAKKNQNSNVLLYH